MKKCKFNVGDEVVLNQSYEGLPAGTRGKVVRVWGSGLSDRTLIDVRYEGTSGVKGTFDFRLNLVTKAPECKLKVGDRVVLNRDLEKCRKGVIGTVKSIGQCSGMVYVTLDDKRVIGTYERHFDLVPETPKYKFKVGDRVKANEKSNDRYFSTNLRNKFTGVVTVVNSNGLVNIRRDRDGYLWDNLEPEYFDLIESTPEIHITVEGNKTIAVYKNGIEGKKAVAKCSPEDTFDFGIGAKLALERLGVLPTEKKGESITVGGFKIGDRVNYNGVNGTVICFSVDDSIGVEFDKPNGTEHDCGGVFLKAGTTGTKCTSRWLSAKDLTPGEVPQYYNGKVVCIKNNIGNKSIYTVGKVYEFKNGKLTANDGTAIPITHNIESFKEWKEFSSSDWAELHEELSVDLF